MLGQVFSLRNVFYVEEKAKIVYQKHTKVLVELILVLLAVCHAWFITSDLVILIQILCATGAQ